MILRTKTAISRFQLSIAALALGVTVAAAGETDAQIEASPWGISSGAELVRDHPKFNPLLHDAGVTWLRYFPEWNSVEKEQGQFNWEFADQLVADCTKNNIRLAAGLAYGAKWATTDGSTRRVPFKDIKYWEDYVTACASRYRGQVSHWEVWNEFNGSFAVGGNNPQTYADLVKATYDSARKVDPDAKIGVSVANFDIGFIDAAIKAGAKGKFDYIAVHPYENLGAVLTGGEQGFLSLVPSLRKMLKENGERADIPLWITEIGVASSSVPNAERDAGQADALVMCYTLSLAQGFEKIFWFEARGSDYGKGQDHGIIRRDWTFRPIYHAMKNMTSLLGVAPKYIGWLNAGNGGYGFAFQGQSQPVLVMWAPYGSDKKHEVSFENDTVVYDLLGQSSPLEAGTKLALKRSPVFVAGITPGLQNMAAANVGKPYPWGKDYATEKVGKVALGATNRNEGISQFKPDTTEVVHGLDWSARRSTIAKGREGLYAYFRVDPTFAGFGNKELEITVVARRNDPKTPANFALMYESLGGYKWAPEARWHLPEGEEWVEHTWKVADANFVGAWGWNFRTDGGGSKGEFQIKEIRVKKP